MTAENNPVRQEFIDMYEENLINEMDAKGDDVSEDEERTMRVNAMVDTALQVRKDMDPLLATRLKSLENLKEYNKAVLHFQKHFINQSPQTVTMLLEELFDHSVAQYRNKLIEQSAKEKSGGALRDR